MNDFKVKVLPYLHLMRLHRPIGILLLLWPTLSALWIAAEGKPDVTVFIVFVLGVILMRSAGCVINDYADRDIDGQVFRTKDRPLAAGILQAKQALLLFAGLGATAFLLVLFLNSLAIWMSVIGLFLAATYPFTKRYTYLPQLYLGAAFGWAIPMAFAAQTNAVPTVAWLLFLANIIWATVYDTFYAMADRKEDLLIGVKSTAILFAEDDRKITGILQLSFLLLMWSLGAKLEMTMPYYLGLLCVLALFGYQQFLIRDRESSKCFQAFINNNWVGAVIFFAIVVDYGMR
ncbi:MAG: 4-hydroxybenzoate octaprenyltransferase [Gammaproteobacteria bacterium]|nr:MAG: 4-hydroxybenzoate octaprenyltransferase [Gammaproteobacteria bacterium]